jgi:hypothetical protein
MVTNPSPPQCGHSRYSGVAVSVPTVHPVLWFAIVDGRRLRRPGFPESILREAGMGLRCAWIIVITYSRLLPSLVVMMHTTGIIRPTRCRVAATMKCERNGDVAGPR